MEEQQQQQQQQQNKEQWTEAKLATTAAEDLEWLAIKEESLFSNEAYFLRKYNDLADEDKQEKGSQKNEEKETEAALEHELDIEGEDKDSQIQQAIQQWSKQFNQVCSVPLQTSTSFLNGINKRISVQHRLHLAHQREKARKKLVRTKQTARTVPAGGTVRSVSSVSVPVVVRLGVLSLFPLLEALMPLPQINFSLLCSRTLSILSAVLADLPPFALHDEPADCLDAFQAFILQRVLASSHSVVEPHEIQAVEALIGLVASRGTPQDLLAAIEVMLQIHKGTATKNVSSSTVSSSPNVLRVGKYLQQLVEFGKNKDVSVMWDNTLTSTWAFSTPSLLPHRKSTSGTLGTLASDGSFLYVMHGHNGSTSLMKVGTGYGDTIQGHVYLRNASFLDVHSQPQQTAANPTNLPDASSNNPSNDTTTNSTSLNSSSGVKEAVDPKHRKWLIYLQNRLFIYCGETVPKTTDNNVPTQTNTTSTTAAKSASDTTASGYILHSLSTLTLHEDAPSKLTLTSSNVSSNDAIISDGRFIYVIKSTKGLVEVFDPSRPLNVSGQLDAIHSLQLTAPSTSTSPPNPPPTNPTNPPPAFPSIFLEKGGWYITGRQLVCVVAPEILGSSEHLIRVWTLPTGAHLLDVTTRTKPPSSVACYDSNANVIWCYDEAANKIAEFANSGPSGSTDGSSFPLPYTALSPENILSTPVSPTEPESALQVGLVILAHMDRVARHHLSAKTNPHADSTHKGFCVAHNVAVYSGLHKTMVHAGEETHNQMVYVLSAAIRILRANIHDLLAQNKSITDIGSDAPAVFSNLKAVLLHLINKPLSSDSTHHIQQEACSVLALGFELFFTQDEQINFLVDLLASAKTSSTDKLMLSRLLVQLLEWDHVTDILLEREATQGALEDKMEVDSSQAPATSEAQQTPLAPSKRKNAYRLLVALVNYVFDETKATIDQIAAEGSTTKSVLVCALVSPPLRLLLALQRSLVIDPIYHTLLAQYSTELLTSSISLFDYVNSRHAEILPNERLENALHNSLPGILLPALATALSSSQFISSLSTFPTNNLPLLLRAVHSVDRLTHRLPDALAADERYVRRQRTDMDRRIIVETTHPYAHGPNQIKQTVSIPGAKSLLLVFDPRSRTTNSSSDILQLFHSSAMTEAPILNPRDGSPFLAGSNWPHQMAIDGDSVTFVFSANSRAEKGGGASAAAQRWGFRCIVSDLNARAAEPLAHWLLDLENTLVHLTGKCISTLIEGAPVTEQERAASAWIEDELFWGGLEETSSQLDPFLVDLIDGNGQANMLFRWGQKQTKGRPIVTPVAAKFVDGAERLVVASILKHLGLCSEAKSFAQLLTAPSPVAPPTLSQSAEDSHSLQIEKFSHIGQFAGKVAKWIVYRGQLEKEWQMAIEEKQKDTDLFARFQGNSQWLQELCSMKGVEYDLMDERASIKNLYVQLQNAIAAGFTPTNPYERAAETVVQRARMLLRVVPAKKSVIHPSAETSNPFAIHRTHTFSSELRDEALSSQSGGLKRSVSVDPDRPLTISRVRKIARESQQTLAFTRRVDELRKWLQAYKGWKRWQEGILETRHRTPLHAIVAFVESDVQMTDLEAAVGARVERAKARIEGLTALNQLLEMQNLGSVRHLLLGLLDSPLAGSTGGGHYLDNLHGCGAGLTGRVTVAFSLFFEQAAEILREARADSTSALLALRVCCLAYRQDDVPLLLKADIFQLLHTLVTDLAVLPPKSLPEAAPTSQESATEQDSMDIDKPIIIAEADGLPAAVPTPTPTITTAHNQATRRAEREKRREERQERKRKRMLQQGGWKAIQLLCAESVFWDGELLSQALRILCSELKQQLRYMSEMEHTDDPQVQHIESGSVVFELLSLLNMLSHTHAAKEQIAEWDNIATLVGVLTCGHAAPRAKRIALRLALRFLPHAAPPSQDSFLSLIEYFLDAIGACLFDRATSAPALTPTSSTTSTTPTIIQTTSLYHDYSSDEECESDLEVEGGVEWDDSEDVDMYDEDEDEDDEEDAGVDDAPEPQADMYTVYLDVWATGYKRLIEVCLNCIGQEFFVQGSVSSVFRRQTTEAKAKQIIQELEDGTQPLLKMLGKADAERLAKVIAESGGSTTVVPSASTSNAHTDESKTLNSERFSRFKRRGFIHTRRPHTHGMLALGEGYIALVRRLMDPKVAPLWAEVTNKAIYGALKRMPELANHLTTSSSMLGNLLEPSLRSLASLAVLGGLPEVLHQGSRAILKETGNTDSPATVVEYIYGSDTASIVLDSDPYRAVQRVEISQLKPVPDVPVDSSVFVLTPDIIPSFLCLLDASTGNTAPGDISPFQSSAWLVAKLKSGSLKALNTLLTNKQSADTFFSVDWESYLSQLQKRIQVCTNSQIDVLESKITTLGERLWELTPSVDSASGAGPVPTTTLTYSAHSHLADQLPTSFARPRVGGFVVRGHEKRTAEFSGLDHPSSSGIRHRSTATPVAHESIMQANAPIPATSISDYYFEVTIENMEAGGVVSVGLAPEATKAWGNSSYRYQANGKRSWFSGGSRRQENYGTYYRAKSVIGCWWKVNEKVIHFIKDGKDLGIAFRGLVTSSEKLVPTVGLGRGVRVKINFGQEPFTFNVRASEGEPGETEEARAKRMQEEDNRIKKEREEEEARRKKEKENEEAARLEAAQPILQMGYELKKALFAMQNTGYSGAEAAVMWLLENPDVVIPDDDKDKEKEPEKEKAKEQKEEKPAEIAVDEKLEKVKEPTDTVPMDISPSVTPLPEKNYSVTSSAKYFLDDCFTYHDTDETIPSKDGAPGASEWEEAVIPEIRTYMENDGFSNFEVEEYLCQLRNQLTQGNEAQARSIVQQIMGDAAINVRFPGSRSQRTSTNATTAAAVAANPAAPAAPAVTPLKMEEVRNHMWVMVSETAQVQWVPAMDKTLGRVGVVKCINHSEGCVLVQFYHAELAAAEEWWYPVRCLSRSHAHQPHSSLTTISSVIDSLTATESDLLAHYARRVILSLALHRGPVQQGPLHTKDVLTLAAAEHLAVPFVRRPPLTHVREYLAEYISQQGPEQLVALAEQVSELLGSDSNYVSTCSAITNSESPASSTPMKIAIDNASTLVVMFDQQSHFPANNQARLVLYEDEGCTALVKQFTSKTQLHTITLNGSRLWVAVENTNGTSSSGGRELVRYKLVVSPLTPSFGLAMWLSDYLLQNIVASNAIASSTDTTAPLSEEIRKRSENIIGVLFNSLVSYAYSCEYPTPMKEEIFSAISRVARTATSLPSPVSLPWTRLLKLKEEMNSLQAIDKKRQLPTSSYLQNLIEVMTAAYEPFVAIAAQESKPDSSMSDKIMDEDLSVAIAIATTLQNTLKGTETSPAKEVSSKPTTPPATPAPQDANTTTTTPSVPAPESVVAANPPPAPAVPVPPFQPDTLPAPIPAVAPVELAMSSIPEEDEDEDEDEDDEEDQEGHLNGALEYAEGDDMIYDDDEEMAAAIAASMQTSSAEKPKEESVENKPESPVATTEQESNEKSEAKPAEPAPSETVVPEVVGEVKPNGTNADESMDAEYSHEGDASMDYFSAAMAGDMGEDMDDEMTAALALSMQSAGQPQGEAEGDDDEDDDDDDDEDEEEEEDNEEDEGEAASGAVEAVTGASVPFTPPSVSQPSSNPPPVRNRAVRRRVELANTSATSPIIAPTATTSTSTTTTTTTTTTSAAPSSSPPPPATPAPTSTNTTASASSSPTVVSPTESIAVFPDWFEQLMRVLKTLNTLRNVSKSDAYWKMLIRKAWAESAKDSIRDRLLVIEGLNTAGLDKADEITAAIRRVITEHGRIYEEGTHVDIAKGYCIVELVSHERIPDIIRKLNKHKLRFKPSTSLSTSSSGPSLRSSASFTAPLAPAASPALPSPAVVAPVPPASPAPTTPVRESSGLNTSSNINPPDVHVLKVTRFRDLEKAKDNRAKDYLQARLVSKGAFTPKFRSVLADIFGRFGTPGADVADAVLSPTQLDSLQLSSTGEHLTAEALKYILDHFTTKPIPATEGIKEQELGLTLDGFRELYLRQAIDEPLSVWEELTRLGYDIHLDRSSYATQQDAETALGAWQREWDEMLVEWVDTMCQECDISSPEQLPLSLIPYHHPLPIPLASIPIPTLRLRFAILRQLNADLGNTLALVNFQNSKIADSIAAVISSNRGLIFHKSKMRYVFDVLDKTSTTAPQPVVQIDRLKMAARKEQPDYSPSALQNCTFGIAFSQIRNVAPALLRRKKPTGAEPHFSIKIVFKGENVEGEGGPYRQFFTDISKELQGVLPLLVPCPNAQAKVWFNRDKWIPTPSCDSALHLTMYEFLGRLMGVALRTGVLLTLDLPPFVWKPLVGIPATRADLKQIDYSLYGYLKYIRACERADFEGETRKIFEKFTTTRSDKTKVPLVPGGEDIEVTYANREEYAQLVERVRLHESDRQIQAMRKGLSTVVPESLLDLMTWQDLEWRVCGRPYVDVGLLRRHTEYSVGVSPDAAHIGYLWQTLHEFGQQDLRRFLRFAWAQERLPADDQEFTRTQTRMLIKPSSSSDPNNTFPQADTCFFNLTLPEYTSQQMLKQRLLFAVNTDADSMDADQPQEDANGNRLSPFSNEHDYSDSDSE